jgi:trehalose-6-phosphate synthase
LRKNTLNKINGKFAQIKIKPNHLLNKDTDIQGILKKMQALYKIRGDSHYHVIIVITVD